MFLEIHDSRQALAELRAAGVTSGSLVGLVVADGSQAVRWAGLATDGGAFAIDIDDLENDSVAQLIADVDVELRPRWVLWSNATASTLIAGGRPAALPSRC